MKSSHSWKFPLLILELDEHFFRYALLVSENSPLCFSEKTFEVEQWHKNIPESARELKSFFESEKIPYSRCVISIPSQQLFQQEIEFQNLNAEYVHSYLMLQADQFIPLHQNDRVLIHSPDLPHDQSCLFAIAKTKLNSIQNLCQLLNAKITALLPKQALLKPTLDCEHLQVYQHNNTQLNIAKLHPPAIKKMSVVLLENRDSVSSELRQLLATLQPETTSSLLPIALTTAKPDDWTQILVDNFKALGCDVTLSQPELNFKSQLNFLNPIEPNTIHWLKKESFKTWTLLLSVAILISSSIAFLLYFKNKKLQELNAQWLEIQPSVTQLQIQQEKLQSYRDWTNGSPIELNSLDQISAIFPEQGQAWLKSFDLKDKNKINLSGMTKNNTVWLTILKKMQADSHISNLEVLQVQGESPLTFSIRFSWSKL